ncbi:2-oxoglutarate receptor 1-like protein [Labeo rohita]|uniref:2-oxoglutarate receptor 1-like protein n=1 Tax=Labeo rohita TaxID=84645 RepID=A0A498P440_LABRO|nr:2-oxoglutarate receptor 1-like protein [Labeo rohita]
MSNPYYGSSNSSSDSCTNVDDLVKRYYLPAMYGAIFIVGVVGNITALLVYVVKVRPWRSSTIIMVNLVITDLLFMISMPFLTYYYVSDDSWTLGVIMCRFTRFIFHFNLYGSILFLTCLAIFRYVAVVHPSHGRIIKQKRWGTLACVLGWTVAVAEISPVFNHFDTVPQNNKTYCLDLASSNPQIMWPYSWVLTVLGYLVPLIVVCICYWRIMKVLKKGPHTGSSKRVRARRLIVLILTCFIVCFFPFHVLRALRIYTSVSDDSWTLGVIMCRFTRFIFHFNLYGSILFLTCLAIFRYVAVVHPSHGRIIKQKRWGTLACVLGWTVAVAEISPVFNHFDTVPQNNKTYCWISRAATHKSCGRIVGC